MPLNPFSDSDFAIRSPTPYGPPDPNDPFAGYGYGGQGEDEGEEEEDFLTTGAPVGIGPIGSSLLGLEDIQVLLQSVSLTNQAYAGKGERIPQSQLTLEKQLLGLVIKQRDLEAGRVTATAKEARDWALELKKIADANARNAASIGAANARNAAGIAAQMERTILSQEGQTLRTQYTQEQQALRQEKLLAYNREKLGAETEQNAIANKLQELQLGISAGRLNLDTALGVLEKWLKAYPSSLPEGAEYVPGFQPGGGVEAGARLAGLSYNPELYRARPVPFNPADVVRQTMGGG